MNDSQYFVLEMLTRRFSPLRAELVDHVREMPEDFVVWERRSLTRRHAP